MKYKVAIDRTTIKRNKDAGRQDYLVPGNWRHEVVVFGAQTEIVGKLGEIGHIIAYFPLFDGHYSFKIILYLTHMPENLEEMLKENNMLLCSRNSYRSVQPLRSLVPEPEYLFRYVPTKVRCYCCAAEFLHTELRDEYAPFFGDDSCSYFSNICPCCQAPDCCELEFESMEGVPQEYRDSAPLIGGEDDH